MPRNPKSADRQQAMELATDFLGEDRHEFVAKLAYKFWEERGRPLGSPEADWFAAERAVYSSLLTSGLISPSSDTPLPVAEQITGSVRSHNNSTKRRIRCRFQIRQSIDA